MNETQDPHVMSEACLVAKAICQMQCPNGFESAADCLYCKCITKSQGVLKAMYLTFCRGRGGGVRVFAHLTSSCFKAVLIKDFQSCLLKHRLCYGIASLGRIRWCNVSAAS